MPLRSGFGTDRRGQVEEDRHAWPSGEPFPASNVPSGTDLDGTSDFNVLVSTRFEKCLRMLTAFRLGNLGGWEKWFQGGTRTSG
jgi:hypothetical protein